MFRIDKDLDRPFLTFFTDETTKAQSRQMSLFRRRLPRGMFIFFAPSLKAQGGRIQIQYKVGFSNEGTGEAAVHAWSWDSSVLKWLMPSQLCTWFYFCLSSKQGKWGGNRRILPCSMRVVNALIVRWLRQDMNDCIHLLLLLNSSFLLEDRILHSKRAPFIGSYCGIQRGK